MIMLSVYPLVSVRIPAFNHEGYIKSTLDSILLQDYPNLEIVIIDDASTDGTWDAIQAWISGNQGAVNITALRHEVNQGITKTLNELIGLCSGKYLAGVASDDYLLPDSIKSRVNYLESNPDKSAVFGDCLVINERGEVIFESALSQLYSMDKAKLLDGGTLAREIIVNWGVVGGTLMVRKSVHQSIKFDSRLLVEDFDFYLKMVARDLLGFIDQGVSAYRLHQSNTSRSKKFSVRRKLDFIRAVYRNISSFPLYCWPWFLQAIWKRI